MYLTRYWLVEYGTSEVLFSDTRYNKVALNGQKISEYQGKISQIFFVHILGNMTTSNFHFEISWPLVTILKALETILCVIFGSDRPWKKPRFTFVKKNKTLHRGAFCQFPFRRIYYYGSNKATGKETGKTHFCALRAWKIWQKHKHNI